MRMKKKASMFIFIFVILALVYLLFRIGILDIVNLVFKANPGFLFLALICLFLMFFVRNGIWIKASKELSGKNLSYFSTLPIFLAGTLFNALTPGTNMGGEPVKAYYLSKKYGGRKTVYLAGLFLQIILYHIVLFVFLIFSLLMLIYFFSFLKIKFLFSLIVFLLVFISILLFILFISRKRLSWIIKKFSFLYIFFNFENRKDFSKFLIKNYKNFKFSLKKLLKRKVLLFYLLLFSFLARIFFYLSFYFVFLSLNIDFPLIYVIISTTIVLFISDLSTIPEGFGVMEGGLIAVYSLFGLNSVQAASSTLLSRSLRYFYALGLGFLSYLHIKIKI
jgi:hypothetical protein